MVVKKERGGSKEKGYRMTKGVGERWSTVHCKRQMIPDYLSESN